jgi:hypothetical protein
MKLVKLVLELWIINVKAVMRKIIGKFKILYVCVNKVILLIILVKFAMVKDCLNDLIFSL